MAFFRLLSDDSVLLWALNTFIQITVIATIALLFAWMIKRNSVMRWWVLGSALALILISPGLALLNQSFGLGALAVLNPSEPASASAPVSAFSDEWAARQASQPRIDQLPQPFDHVRSVPDPTPLHRAAKSDANSISITDTRSPAATDDALHGAEWMITGLRICLTIWVAGALLLLTRLLRSWYQLTVIRRQSVSVIDTRLISALRHACDQLNVQTPPQLLKSEEVHSPVATGILKPAILLPEALPTSLTACQLQDILLHEVAHVARHDQVIVFAQNIAACLYWLNPLVRLLNRRFAQAREEICDNYVLHESEAPGYSRTLLELAESVQPSRVPATAVGVLDDWSLEERVAGILRRGRNLSTRLTAGSLTIVALLFGLFLAMGGLSTITAVAAEPQDEVVERPVGSPVATRGNRKSSGVSANDVEPLHGVPLPHSAELHFSGRVVDPQGRPVAGARIYFSRRGARQLAVSGDDGKFEFGCTKGQLPNNAAWGNIRLVAVASGFGMAISPALRFEDTGKGQQDLIARNPNKSFGTKSRPRVLKLVRDDIPIRGRLVDLQGEPVTDASIQLRFVNKAYARFAFDAVRTDPDGRFEIRGIGRDRVVRLVAKGEHTAFSVFFARTQDGPPTTTSTREFDDPFDPASRSATPHRVVYGARLTHAVSPSVPVHGRITDAKTGEPISGVTVYGYELAESSETGRREDFNTVSDSEGRYRLVGLPIGRNRMIASAGMKTSYLPAAAHVSVSDDVKSVTRDFSITRGILLRGTVTDKVSGQPLPGFIDYAAMKGNEHFDAAKSFHDVAAYHQYPTDANGKFAIPVLPGRGFVAFRTRSHNDKYPVGILSEEARSVVQPGQPFLPSRPTLLMPARYNSITLIDPDADAAEFSTSFQLTQAPDVIVRITDSEGQPVNGADVEEILTFNGTGRGNAVNVPGHAYQVQQFAPDNPTVLIARHQQKRLIGRLQIDNLQDAAMTLTMKKAAGITGRVVDDSGNPIVVRIDGYGRLFATDDDGRFELPLVIPEFSITIHALHQSEPRILGPLFENITLTEGESRDLGNVTIRKR